MSADWIVLSALVPPAGEELLMVDALRRLGARAIERRGERVVAWLPHPGDVDGLLREARGVLRATVSLADAGLAWEMRSHAQWVESWVHAVEPRRVTDRIVVAPAGREGERDAAVDGDDVVIRIEAGIAFGTAEHATTRGCLALLESAVRSGDCVLDIGTGSGILAIAAARLGARRVLALEADAPSCESARRNVVANGVSDVVTVRQLIVEPADLRRLPRHDIILANLEADLIGRLLPALRKALAGGGTLIVAGVTAGERDRLLEAADDAGFVLHAHRDTDGWLSAAFVEPRG